MKRKNLLILCGSILGDLLLSGCGASIATIDKVEFTLESKSGNNVIDVSLENGILFYQVKNDGKEVVRKSELGLIGDGFSFDYTSNLVSVKTSSFDISYEAKAGKDRYVSDTVNQMTVTLTNGGYYLDVIFRAYDDGYAFRYKLYNYDESVTSTSIDNELSYFRLPKKTMFYYMPSDTTTRFSYEGTYFQKTIERLNSNEMISFPMLYETSDGVYSLLNESDLISSDYIGSFLVNVGNDTLKSTPAYGASSPVKVSLPFTSPWRTGTVGNLETIVESNLVEKLYDEVEYYKPENYETLSEEEKDTYNYDWVEPGVASWSWLDYPNDQSVANFDIHKQFIDLSAEMGWQWYILDGGWQNGNDNDAKKVIDYATSKGIGIIVWCHSLNELGVTATRRVNLDKRKSLGAKGIKVDFFDGYGANNPNMPRGESQETIKLYEEIFKDCASRQLVVDCHGTNKPTGERREYPNLLSKEAIRGQEMFNMDTEQMTAIPYIRGSVGPVDFTPSVYPRRTGMTIGNQIALPILFESGLTVFGDTPENFEKSGAKDFYKNFPGSWDETEFIAGEVMSYTVLARRSGSKRYIGGNTTLSRDASIDLSFLNDDATYDVAIYTDNPADSTTITPKYLTATKGDTLDMSMVKNGGFGIILTPQ
jgi:hypothetical protein